MSNITSAGNSRRFENLFDAALQAVNLAPAVAATLGEELLLALEEGEILPDLVLLQKLISRRLAQASRELDDGDNARKHFKNLDRHRKGLLEQATIKLRDALVDVRFTLDRTLPAKDAKAFFEGRSNLTRLKSPLIERVSTRLVDLLEDPKFGWDQIADPGHRTIAAASRQRLKSALEEFLQAKAERVPEKDALVLAQGSFDREFEEKRRRLQRHLRHLRGMYEGAGFEREAAVLSFRRRATPPKAEDPAPPEPTKVAAVQPTAAGPPPPADPAAPNPLRRKRRRSRRRSPAAR